MVRFSRIKLKVVIRFARVQDIFVPWHTEYFRLRQFEKYQMLKEFSYLHFLLEQDIRLSGNRCPPCIWRKGISLSPRWRDTEKIPNKQDLPPVHYTDFLPLSVIFLLDLSLFTKPSIKTLSFNDFFGFSSLYEGSHVM